MIVADPNAGPVTITVVPDPNGPNAQHGQYYGAANVKQISLNATGVNGRVDALSISGSLNELGSTVAASAGALTIGSAVINPIEFHDVSGPIQIGGCLYTGLSSHSLQNLTIDGGGVPPSFPPTVSVFGPYGQGRQMSIGQSLQHLRVDGAVEGTIVVTGRVRSAALGGELAGAFECQELGDSVALTGMNLSGPLSGQLTVHGAVYGPNEFEDLPASGAVSLGSIGDGLVKFVGTPQTRGPAIGGSLIVESDANGHIQLVDGDLQGTVWIKGALNAAVEMTYLGGSSHVTGTLRVSGPMNGYMYIGGSVLGPPGGLSGGHIVIDGPLGSPEGGGQIHIYGEINETGYVVTNNDVSDPDNSPFGPFAFVLVWPWYYYETTPAEHIWRVSKCRGDCNNSNYNPIPVDYDDVNPFILALTDPETYDLTYPGLGGPVRLFHADCNCDGLVDFNDINALVALIELGTCVYDCPGDDAPPLGAPEVTAGELRAHLRPENRVTLLSVVSQTATQARSRALRDYWQAVYEHLTR
ncbi:MAG: hypothetical protein AB1716_10270 [Planctomycetota bacterium]